MMGLVICAGLCFWAFRKDAVVEDSRATHALSEEDDLVQPDITCSEESNGNSARSVSDTSSDQELWPELLDASLVDAGYLGSALGSYRTRARILDLGELGLVRVEETVSWDNDSQREERLRYMPMAADQVLAQLDASMTALEVQGLVQSLGFVGAEELNDAGLYAVALSSSRNIEDVPFALERLSRSSSRVSYAEPDFLVRTFVEPNDPMWADQWWLSNSSGLSANYDIDAPQGWDIRNSAPEVKIAILDTGVRLSHEDLAANLWVNSAESVNGRDDDGNGYVDDIHGINTIFGTGDPSDNEGHGTHVAGIAGAEGNNRKGISGVVWDTQLMGLKFLGTDGTGTLSNAIKGIEYAIEQRVDIINNSWGGEGRSQALFDALKKASDRGILIVSAAGNSGQSLAEYPIYPAAFSIPSQVVVAGTDRLDRLAGFSNFDPARVHIAAPYGAISTYSNSDDEYVEAYGTSMSTPMVSGTLASLVAEFPDRSPVELIDRLLSSVELRPGLENAVSSRGRLNLNRALKGEHNRPGNDMFADAEGFKNQGGIVSGTLSFATIESGEEQIDQNGSGQTVWYKWQSSHQGSVRLTSSSVSYRSTIGVFRGMELGSLELISRYAESSISDTESFAFEAEAGATYFIQVDKLEAEGGAFTLQLRPAPSNDDFETRIELSGESFSVEGRNYSATVEPDEPQVYPSASGQTVWYVWTAPKSDSFYLSAESLDGQAYVAVFSGSDFASLERVGVSNENGAPNRLLFSAEAGVTYYFAVDSLSKDGLEFRLKGQFLEEPVFSLQPSDKILRIGQTGIFSAGVFGGVPLYQWFKDGEPIEGETNSYLEVHVESEEQEGLYHVEAVVAGRRIVSREAKLTISESSLRFLVQPRAQVVAVGQAVALTSLVDGAGGVTFQWYKDREPIPGADGGRFEITECSIEDSGFYMVSAFRNGEVTNSNAVYLDVVEEHPLQGVSWLPDFLPEVNFSDIDHVGGKFFALGEDVIAVSSNGIDWFYTTSSRTGYLESVCYGNGVYLVGGDQGISLSEDGIRWEHRLGGPYSIHQISFFLDYFWITTGEGLFKSPDGKELSKVDIPFDQLRQLRGVSYGDGRIVVNGYDGVYYSDDGIAWSKADGTLPSRYAELHFFEGKWYALNEYQRSISVSDDTKSWSPIPLPENVVQEMCFDRVNGTPYVLGSEKVFRYNGSTWEELNSGSSYLFAIGSHGGLIVAANGARLGLLDDLVNDPPVLWNRPEKWWEYSNFFFAGGLYYAAAFNYFDELRVSADGHKWQQVPAPVGTTFERFVVGNDVYVSSGKSGPSPTSMQAHGKHFQGIAFGEGVFVGVEGRPYYSVDGKQWSEGVGVNTNDLGRLMYSGGLFLASTFEGSYTSRDGKTWSEASSNLTNIEYLASGNGLFVAMKGGGESFASVDGVTWKSGSEPRLDGVGAHSQGLAFYDGRFVTSYWNGYIFTSLDGLSWEAAHGITQGYDIHQMIPGDQSILLVGDGLAVIGGESGDDFTLEVTGISNGSKVLVGASIDLGFQVYSADGGAVTVSVKEGSQDEVFLPQGMSGYTFTPRSKGSYSITINARSESGVVASESFHFEAVSSINANFAERMVHDIAYFRGAIYASGQAGILYITTDGKEWVEIQTPTGHDLRFFHTSNAGICLTDAHGGLLFSRDGVQWTLIEGLDARFSFNESPESFFVVPTGYDSYLLSADGLNWHSAKTGELVAGGVDSPRPELARFFGSSGVLYGYPGSENSSDSLVSGYLRVTDYVNLENFGILMSGEGVYKSVAGGQLEEIPLDWNAESGRFERLERAGDTLFLFTEQRIRFVSDDGLSWTAVDLPFAVYSNVVTREGYFYIVTSDGLARSSNAIEWEVLSDTIAVQSFSGVPLKLLDTEFGFFVLSYDWSRESYLAYSADGMDWEVSHFEYSDGITNILGDEDSIFAVSTDQNGSYRLVEGGEWEPISRRIRSGATFGKGYLLDYVGYGTDRIYKSEDGEDWQAFSGPEWFSSTSHREPLLFDGERYFWATNAYDALGRSSDGVTWTKLDPPNTDQIIAIKYFKEKWYAGGSGRVFVSADGGSSWTRVQDESVGSGSGVAVTGDRIAVGTWERVSFSSDGSVWNSIVPDTPVRSIVSDGEYFYFGSNQIYRTRDGTEIELVVSDGSYDSDLFAVGKRVFVVGEGLAVREITGSDISLTSLVVDRGDYGVGDSVRVSLSLENFGSDRFTRDGGGEVWLSLSRNRGSIGVGPDGYQHEMRKILPLVDLAVGESVSFEFDFRVPDRAPAGDYHLSARLADGFNSADSNRSNDVVFSSGAPPIHISSKKLSLSVNGLGRVDSNVSISSVARNQVVLLTPVPAIGHRFEGWSGIDSISGDVLSITMDSDVSLVASFQPNEYSLEVETVGLGRVVGLPEGPILFGQELFLQAEAGEHATFAGWSGDYSKSGDSLRFLMGQNVKLEAIFVQSFGQWMTSRYTEGQLSDPSFNSRYADPDGNGLSHHWEYLLGVNGSSQNLGDHFSFELVGGELCLIYTENRSSQGYEIRPIVSNDLAEFEPRDLNVRELSKTNERRRMEVRLLIEGARFIKLESLPVIEGAK